MNFRKNEITDSQPAAGQKAFVRIYWIPMIVLIVGLPAFCLLVWMHRIHKKLSSGFDHADAIMDIRIRIGPSHMLLEEVLFGDAQAELTRIEGE